MKSEIEYRLEDLAADLTAPAPEVIERAAPTTLRRFTVVTEVHRGPDMRITHATAQHIEHEPREVARSLQALWRRKDESRPVLKLGPPTILIQRSGRACLHPSAPQFVIAPEQKSAHVYKAATREPEPMTELDDLEEQAEMAGGAHRLPLPLQRRLKAARA